mgnify:CR=1 FL=1
MSALKRLLPDFGPMIIAKIGVNYYDHAGERGLFGAPHGTSRWRGRVWRRIRMLTRAMVSHLRSRRKPRPILIYDHSRKVRVDELWVEIYMRSLIQQLNDAQDDQISKLFEVYEYLSYLE